VPALRIEGYVIVSADGMLADARNVMPDELKFEGDKAFFTAALDRADLILHGGNSYEDQPNSPRRRRIILTRKVDAIAPDPSNPKATLWNPAGTSFDAACHHAGVDAGTVAVIVVREFTVKEALTPPNWTTVAPVNPNPVMVTEIPTGPLVGLKESSAGTGGGTGPATVNRAIPDT